jgi:hypothetical protein
VRSTISTPAATSEVVVPSARPTRFGPGAVGAGGACVVCLPPFPPASWSWAAASLRRCTGWRRLDSFFFAAATLCGTLAAQLRTGTESPKPAAPSAARPRSTTIVAPIDARMPRRTSQRTTGRRRMLNAIATATGTKNTRPK